jgi:hypothetical protein
VVSTASLVALRVRVRLRPSLTGFPSGGLILEPVESAVDSLEVKSATARSARWSMTTSSKPAMPSLRSPSPSILPAGSALRVKSADSWRFPGVPKIRTKSARYASANSGEAEAAAHVVENMRTASPVPQMMFRGRSLEASLLEPQMVRNRTRSRSIRATRLDSTIGGRDVPVNGVRPTCHALYRRYQPDRHDWRSHPARYPVQWSKSSSRKADAAKIRRLVSIRIVSAG